VQLGQPQAVVAQFVGQAELVQVLLVELGVAAIGGALHLVKQAEFHGIHSLGVARIGRWLANMLTCR